MNKFSVLQLTSIGRFFIVFFCDFHYLGLVKKLLQKIIISELFKAVSFKVISINSINLVNSEILFKIQKIWVNMLSLS